MDASVESKVERTEIDGGDLPWGYGENRITVIVRDPDSAYLYWEITDEGIAAARSRLGPGGEHGWFNLRIYDTTGRDFNGTNANDYFDLRVDRADREYYLMIRRPGSSMHAEIGIQTDEGYFQPISRSGRADFPRSAPSPNATLEWMTITSDDAPPCVVPYRSRYSGPEPPLPGRAGAGYVDAWRAGYAPSAQPSEPVREATSWSAHRSIERAVHVERWWRLDEWRAEWRSGLRFLGWEHFDPERLAVEILGESPAVLQIQGGEIIAYGPLRVTIRGFESEPWRRVLSTWSMQWVRATTPLIERWERVVEHRVIAGWEREHVVFGASEQHAVTARGSSELLHLGGSERLWLGASEWIAGGASEMSWLGSSETFWLGASDRRGASDWLGASESASHFQGASESASSWPNALVRANVGAGASRLRPEPRVSTIRGRNPRRRETVTRGYIALVLHAHLPFVRHPEAPSYMEEEWFFEAITETYAPLLIAFEHLSAEGIDFRLTMSFSPSLLSMMTDDLLKERYARKIDTLIELAEKEVDRTWREDRDCHELAKMYRHRFYEIRDCWRRYDGDLVRGYRALQDAGRLEIITCTATHPFFPLLDRNWAAFRAQIHTAASVYERLFGRRSQGMWLGECGYVPGVDELMREEGIRFFFVDTHGVLFADPRPLYGVHAPVYCRSGVAAFWPRHREQSGQGLECARGIPRRSELPRFLSRHRVRFADRLHSSRTSTRPASGRPRASNIMR